MNMIEYFLRIRIIRLGVIFILAIMGGFSLILLIVGSLATGATRHQIYTGFRSRLGGRIAMSFVSDRDENVVEFLCFVLIVFCDCLCFVNHVVIGDGFFACSMYWSVYSQISLH